MNKQQVEALLKTARPAYVEPRLFGLSRGAVVGAFLATIATAIFVTLH